MAMKENSKNVLNYLKANQGKNLTSEDVANALDLTKKQVDGIFTSAIQRKEYGFREEAEIQTEEGTHKKVKFLRLTDSGMALDPDAE